MNLFKWRKPTWGFTTAAIILVAVGSFVVFSVQRYIIGSQLVAHTYATLSQLENINALEREAIIAQRGYLLTQDRRDRSQFWTTKAAMPLQLQSLREMVQGDSTQLALLGQIEQKIRQQLAVATETLDIYNEKGQLAAQSFFESSNDRKLDLEIKKLIEEMKNNETRLLAALRDRAKIGSSLLLLAGSLGIPLSLFILATIYRFLFRENSQRRKSELIASTMNVELCESVAKLKKLSANMETLSNYAGILQSCSEIPELLEITRQTLLGLTPKIAGTIYLIRSSRDHAETAAQWGEHCAQSNSLPVPSECWALRRNQPFFCNNVHRDVKCSHVEVPLSSGSTATACLPLSAQGELMGWLYLSGPGPGPLPDMNLAIQAAEQFSLALANLRLKESLRNQSIHDTLTGLFNRRYLEESLTREISRCERRHLPLVVLMFDLDHFKTFNDKHGHPGGDTLLAAFGNLLQSSCRREDIACRYGGEEFVLILPDANEEVGIERAKAILHATTQLAVSHQGCSLSPVTTSIGLAMFPAQGTTNAALLAAADKALYQAKEQGRNRLHVAS